MNHFGEIRRLGRICRPDIAVITNVGPAHLEGVGSIEGVAKAKAELLETVDPGGHVVLNADDRRVARMAGSTACRVVGFGMSQEAAVRASDVAIDGESVTFTLLTPVGSVTVRLKVPGWFMVSNALAAASVGYCLGQTAEEIKSGLESFDPVKGRMNIFSPGRGIHLIDDTYNANPESMAAAIDALATLRKGRRGIMVAGDMLELGAHAAALHRDVGAKAGGSGISRLYVTGDFAAAVAEGAESEGMDAGRIILGSKEDIMEDLTGRLRPDDWVLVKGSRGMRMEQIVSGIKKWAKGA
jgi:UDP-N-acetylmuramoyl-tripeptide--D-alanyl-D-alanine ligase